MGETDTISRQAAIDALDIAIERYDEIAEKYRKKADIERNDYMDMRDNAYEAQQLAQWLNELKYLREKIEQITIKPEQRWIPCSERFPEVHETGNSFSGVYMQSYPVLVYGVPEGEEECSFHVVTYCDDLNGYTYWDTELDAVTIDGVKAWMPLPEPYRGGEK